MEPIHYETLTNRQILIAIAEAMNTLNDKMTELCDRLNEPEGNSRKR
jgi:hypothetical protein